jgi:pimeloyl-ACP methyl ester carboxylesterase
MTAFVLLHGGMHGPWSWERVTGSLRDAGHQVELVELPGRGGELPPDVGLDEYADVIADAVDRVDGPVALVAHSLGGVVAIRFAERSPDAIDRLVLVNALLLEDGEAAFPVLQSLREECILIRPGALEIADDGSAVSTDPATAVEAYYNRCDPADAAWAAERLCAEPLGPMSVPLQVTEEGFGWVPKTYIGGRDDRVLPWWFQQKMASSAGADLIELDADHSPFLSAPGELVECLLEAVPARS